MDSVTSLLTLRDNLRTNLRDPYLDAVGGGTARSGSTWVFYDEPLGSKYPLIEIEKLDNPSEVISMGGYQQTYWEKEQVFANIKISTKNGFKINVNNVEYMNAHLVEYYLGQIKSTLKAQFVTLWDAGVKGYVPINTTRIEQDKCSQNWFAMVTVRVEFFQK